MNETDVKEKLRTFVCRELLRRPGYPLGDREPVISVGLIDSFALAQIGVFIETEFGVYIPDTDLTVENMDTLELMVSRVVEPPASPATPGASGSRKEMGAHPGEP